MWGIMGVTWVSVPQEVFDRLIKLRTETPSGHDQICFVQKALFGGKNGLEVWRWMWVSLSALGLLFQLIVGVERTAVGKTSCRHWDAYFCPGGGGHVGLCSLAGALPSRWRPGGSFCLLGHRRVGFCLSLGLCEHRFLLGGQAAWGARGVLGPDREGLEDVCLSLPMFPEPRLTNSFHPTTGSKRK